MAILNNLWMRGSKKKLGGTVLYNSMGQTIQRELASSVSNPRTESQMTQRVKWANLVAFYRANKSWMRFAFETKKKTQSEYNKLMSLNVTNSNIYLTKQQASAGACVVAPYIITQGSLPSIEVYEDGGNKLTNIYVSTAHSLEDITVGALAQDLLANNPAFRIGDQISFIRMTQLVNNTTGVPYVNVREYEMLLDPSSQDLFKNFFPEELFACVSDGASYRIQVQNNNNAGGFALILSRTTGGRTLVSTQEVVVMNNEQLIENYSSYEARVAAIESYGESTEAFLSSNDANYGQSQPIALTPISVKINGVEYVWGQYVGLARLNAGKTIEVEFNQPITGALQHFWVDTAAATLPDQAATIVGNKVVVASLNLGELPGDNAIRLFRIDIAGTTYRWGFSVAQSGGLE